MDILVNNAGQASSAPFLKTDAALWQATLAVNLTGVYLCTRACLADMVASGHGRHRQHRQRRRPHGSSLHHRLLRLEARRDQAHARARANSRREHHRQCRLPRLHRHRHGPYGRRRRPPKPAARGRAIAAITERNPQHRLIAPFPEVAADGAVAVPAGRRERDRPEHHARGRRDHVTGGAPTMTLPSYLRWPFFAEPAPRSGRASGGLGAGRAAA